MIRTAVKCGVTTGIAFSWFAAAFAQQANVQSPAFIPIVGPNGDNVLIRDINNARTVVGFDTVARDGVVINATGNVTSFDVTGSLVGSLSPVAINSGGEVAGTWLDQNLFSHIFLRSANGTITSFTPADMGLINVSAINVTGLNDNGTITGYYLANAPDGNFGNNGFVRSRNGDVTFFDVGGTNTSPQSINNSGAITGSYGLGHGFLRSAAGKITLFDVPAAGAALPDSINASGAIAGTWRGNGFVRDAQGTITEFSVGTHQNDDVVTNFATINSKGELAGFYHGLAGVPHGYLRSPHGTIIFFDVPGSSATSVCCINDSGAIAVNASNGAFIGLPGSQDDTFQPGTYLVTDGHFLYMDGGFYLSGDPTVRLWTLVGDNTAQQWKITTVAGGYTIENQGTSQFAYDAGGHLVEGARADVWIVQAVPGGYQFKNRRTGLFLTDPGVSDGAIALSDNGSAWQFLSLLPF